MSKKKNKIMAAILATFGGVGGATVSSVIIAYDAVFPRYERPDYNLKAGQYCIERMGKFPREEIWIDSEGNNIKGYVYCVKKSKGLVVLAHGIHAGADDYLPIINYLLKNKYSVLAYNCTGTYESEGESTVGMCQSLVDINNVIEYIKSNPKYNKMNIFTMGHSWGGYAATAVLALQSDIKGCAVIAPMRNGATMMIEKSEQYVGKLAKAATPIFNTYQKMLFGNYCDYDAIVGINKSNIPILIAHGVDDTVITIDGQSITAKMNEITNPNVVYYYGTGLQGDHNNIWHSEASACYQLKVDSELKLMEIKKGNPLTYEEKKEYYKNINHELYSEVNRELMDGIINLFNNALKK